MLDIVERMPDTTDLQTQLSTNVKVLMAVHNLTQTELAKLLGWDLSILSNRFRGKRQWKLDDLTELARVFQMPAAALLGTTAEVVAAAGPTLTAVNGSITRRYFPAKPYPVTASAQVIDFVTARRLRNEGVALSDAPNGSIVRHVG